MSRYLGRRAVDAAIARRYAAEMVWLADGESSAQSDRRDQKKDALVEALDAVWAEFGV